MYAPNPKERSSFCTDIKRNFDSSNLRIAPKGTLPTLAVYEKRSREFAQTFSMDSNQRSSKNQPKGTGGVPCANSPKKQKKSGPVAANPLGYVRLALRDEYVPSSSRSATTPDENRLIPESTRNINSIHQVTHSNTQSNTGGEVFVTDQVHAKPLLRVNVVADPSGSFSYTTEYEVSPKNEPVHTAESGSTMNIPIGQHNIDTAPQRSVNTNPSNLPIYSNLNAVRLNSMSFETVPVQTSSTVSYPVVQPPTYTTTPQVQSHPSSNQPSILLNQSRAVSTMTEATNKNPMIQNQKHSDVNRFQSNSNIGNPANPTQLLAVVPVSSNSHTKRKAVAPFISVQADNMDSIDRNIIADRNNRKIIFEKMIKTEPEIRNTTLKNLANVGPRGPPFDHNLIRAPVNTQQGNNNIAYQQFLPLNIIRPEPGTGNMLINNQMYSNPVESYYNNLVRAPSPLHVLQANNSMSQQQLLSTNVVRSELVNRNMLVHNQMYSTPFESYYNYSSGVPMPTNVIPTNNNAIQQNILPSNIFIPEIAAGNMMQSHMVVPQYQQSYSNLIFSGRNNDVNFPNMPLPTGANVMLPNNMQHVGFLGMNPATGQMAYYQPVSCALGNNFIPTPNVPLQVGEIKYAYDQSDKFNSPVDQTTSSLTESTLVPEHKNIQTEPEKIDNFKPQTESKVLQILGKECFTTNNLTKSKPIPENDEFKKNENSESKTEFEAVDVEKILVQPSSISSPSNKMLKDMYKKQLNVQLNRILEINTPILETENVEIKILSDECKPKETSNPSSSRRGWKRKSFPLDSSAVNATEKNSSNNQNAEKVHTTHESPAAISNLLEEQNKTDFGQNPEHIDSKNDTYSSEVGKPVATLTPIQKTAFPHQSDALPSKSQDKGTAIEVNEKSDSDKTPDDVILVMENDKKKFLDKKIDDWTVSDVAEFVSNSIAYEYTASFMENEIDGAALKLLTPALLNSVMSMPVGIAIRFLNCLIFRDRNK